MKLATGVTLLLLLALPGIARAGDVAMVARDVPLGARSLEAVQAPIRFDMVGLHWRGSGAVLYRTHRIGGAWSAWTRADADSGPNSGSAEAAPTRGWHDGNAAWAGPSDRIAFRTRGRVTALRAYYLWSRVTRVAARTTQAAGSPQIVSRFGWGANERIVRAKPRYAPTLRLAIVHHTVTTNAYTRAQAPAIVRGIETYHVLGNGWDDIGYNFLIDRYGTVYEGRAGGIARNVIGAHSLGFNRGSVGIALIGTYTSVGPTPAQQAALVKLLAWRLDVAHVDPLSFVHVISQGNPRFHRGAPVTLRAISGHRDTYFTECPGNVLYGRLPAIAAAAARTGLPKIYEPLATSVPAEAVRFTARLSRAAPWTVTVTDAAGAVVATGTGAGTKVDWTWDGQTAQPAPYRWSIESAGARPATGKIGTGTVAPPVASLGALAAAPTVVTPAPDGTGATTHVTFTLGGPATVTARVLDAAGFPALTFASGPMSAGPQALDVDLGDLPDGRYRLQVSARAGGGTVAQAALDLTVDRSIYAVAASASAISPNGDGAGDGTTVSFVLADNVPVRVEVQQAGAVVTTLSSGESGPGPQSLTWNGLDGTGRPLPDGSYQLAVTVTDGLGDVTVRLPLAIDTVAPVLTPVDPSTLRFQLSEPAVVTLTVNGQQEVKIEPAGIFHVPPPKAGVESVTATAQDPAGNVSQPVSWP